jgi:2-polyprenyl-3-methyl-5-hydroxy-6-metoxy-1,4-benzoquinol methylase
MIETNHEPEISQRTDCHAVGLRPKGLGERILVQFAKSPEEQTSSGATVKYTLANALDFARLTIPRFPELVRGKSILDYGCGPGWQTVAMHTQCGARSVRGVDIDDRWLAKARALAEAEGCQAHVSFSRQARPDLIGSFDIAISLCSFEHFADPAGVLDALRSMVKPDGLVIVSFGES